MTDISDRSIAIELIMTGGFFIMLSPKGSLSNTPKRTLHKIKTERKTAKRTERRTDRKAEKAKENRNDNLKEKKRREHGERHALQRVQRRIQHDKEKLRNPTRHFDINLDNRREEEERANYSKQYKQLRIQEIKKTQLKKRQQRKKQSTYLFYKIVLFVLLVLLAEALVPVE